MTSTAELGDLAQIPAVVYSSWVHHCKSLMYRKGWIDILSSGMQQPWVAMSFFVNVRLISYSHEFMRSVLMKMKPAVTFT